MLLPTKHQNLSNNIMVIGADVLHIIKNETLTVEELFQKIKNERQMSLEMLFDTITFLWLIDAVEYSENKISKR